MNIYFLVEGEAELGVYPKWIDFLLESKLKRNLAFDEVVENEYFIFNGGGIGKMVHRSIKNTVQEVIQNPVYDWLIIIVDADDQAINDRIQRIEAVFTEPNFPQLPTNCTKKIIIQNRCFETWLCGHREAHATANTLLNKNVQRFLSYYNVSENDPEFMNKDTHILFSTLTVAKYHAAYLHHLLLPKKYNKGTANQLIEVTYLEKLQERLIQTPTHLLTFNNMLSFFKALKIQL
jgi:hypothetical protein